MKVFLLPLQLFLFSFIGLVTVGWMLTTNYYVLNHVERSEETVNAFTNSGPGVFNDTLTDKAKKTFEIFQYYKDILKTLVLLNGILLVFVLVRITGLLLTVCSYGPAQELLDSIDTEAAEDRTNESGSGKEKMLTRGAGNAAFVCCLPCYSIYFQELLNTSLQHVN